MIKGSAPLPVVVATLMSVACASGQIAPATTGGAPIVIGAVLPLTGEVAVFGVSALNGMRLAVDEANAAGGALGRPLELRARDDKGDATEGAAAFRASIEIDGAIAIAGTLMSKISLAGAPICQAAGVPMVTPTSTNPAVTTVGDYIFRACFVDPYQGYLAASFARKALRARTAACVYDEGFEYSSAIAATFADVFSAL
ncbi:MAG TPA: ABC transporter substrate-binding protein, partial [Spirochaetales bacterium]|nr:ABC transporter substrate-binding protein [Spirochaetales bacterium]